MSKKKEGTSKREVEFKATMSRDQLVTYLEDLAASLKEGNVCLAKGDESVVLELTDTVKVAIEAKEKKDKCKLSLELTWRPDIEPKGDAQGLTISTVAPQQAEAAPAEEDAPAEAGGSGSEFEDDEAEERRHGD